MPVKCGDGATKQERGETMTKTEQIRAVLERDLAGYTEAAQRKGLNPDTVQIIQVLRRVLAELEGTR